jgi:hypothetical protein
MIVVYNKSTLACVGTVASGMTVEQELELNVIPNFGGVEEDYSFIETNETLFHLESINDVVTVVADIPTPVIPPKTEIELLKEHQAQMDADMAAFMDYVLGGM